MQPSKKIEELRFYYSECLRREMKTYEEDCCQIEKALQKATSLEKIRELSKQLANAEKVHNDHVKQIKSTYAYQFIEHYLKKAKKALRLKKIKRFFTNQHKT